MTRRWCLRLVCTPLKQPTERIFPKKTLIHLIQSADWCCTTSLFSRIPKRTLWIPCCNTYTSQNSIVHRTKIASNLQINANLVIGTYKLSNRLSNIFSFKQIKIYSVIRTTIVRSLFCERRGLDVPHLFFSDEQERNEDYESFFRSGCGSERRSRGETFLDIESRKNAPSKHDWTTVALAASWGRVANEKCKLDAKSKRHSMRWQQCSLTANLTSRMTGACEVLTRSSTPFTESFASVVCNGSTSSEWFNAITSATYRWCQGCPVSVAAWIENS